MKLYRIVWFNTQSAVHGYGEWTKDVLKLLSDCCEQNELWPNIRHFIEEKSFYVNRNDLSNVT